MNDPNGMVYHQGIYHLFYQYYPDDIIWGPMHWGHAVSKDLLHWKHRPIALEPDEKGYIFSGCAVVDVNNTSSLGSKENPPLVSIFTYHDEQRKQAEEKSFQSQALAFSLDQGKSWSKFEGNPVLLDENLIDFRDPKVFWHIEIEKWIMIIACGDHVRIYHSPNLIEWEYISSFGQGQGCHEGVWECPDLFELSLGESGRSKWVMLVSLVKGGPNGGSVTQYFIGEFDGFSFKNEGVEQEIKWLDFGTDNYAGVTWYNAPTEKGEKVFIGWMSNWDYAASTPTENWRGAMTLPRTLFLLDLDEGIYLGMKPFSSILNLRDKEIQLERTIKKNSVIEWIASIGHSPLLALLVKAWDKDFLKLELKFTSEGGKCLYVQLDPIKGELLLDRGKLENEGLGDKFTPLLKAPLLKGSQKEGLHIFLDTSSIEIFSCGGAINISAQIFPKENFYKIEVRGEGSGFEEVDISLFELKSIWK